MNLIDGASLSEYITSLKEKKQMFSESRIWNIFTQVHPINIRPLGMANRVMSVLDYSRPALSSRREENSPQGFETS